MTNRMRTTRAVLWTATLAGAIWGLPHASLAAAQDSGPTAQAPAGNPASSEASVRLDKKEFRDVKVSVDNGTATLTGSVKLYQDKADAEKRARKTKGITAVRDLIQVAGPSVPDQVLLTKLQEKLVYDRVFYGNTFDAITVYIENGQVTLGGHVHNLFNRDSALALVSTFPGVKGMVDQMAVDPVSPMDERIRQSVYRAVYGYTSLNRYAMDPAKPIRISVRNGNVELYGVVDSQSDKETAFIRANGVSGVFSVKNYLEAAGQPAKAQK